MFVIRKNVTVMELISNCLLELNGDKFKVNIDLNCLWFAFLTYLGSSELKGSTVFVGEYKLLDVLPSMRVSRII